VVAVRKPLVNISGQLQELPAIDIWALPPGDFSYTFSTTTADVDPGNGALRLNQATQNTATVIRADLLDALGVDITSFLDTVDDSTSTVKGYITISKASDPSKWLYFSVTSLASPSGYKNITVAIVAYSGANPFANGDTLILSFVRNGDKGADGAAGSNGSAGATGASFLAGSGAPAGGTGANGDYYMDTDEAGLFYGPKAAGAWPAGTIIRRMKPIRLKPGAYEQVSSNYATYNVRNGHPILEFDGTTQETAIWSDYLPTDYHGGNLIVDVFWMAVPTSGNVVFDATFERMAVNGDDLDADSFATAQQMTQVAVNGTSGKIAKSTITITAGAAGTDSLAAGEPFRLRLRRVPGDANDTAAGDAQVTAVVIREA